MIEPRRAQEHSTHCSSRFPRGEQRRDLHPVVSLVDSTGLIRLEELLSGLSHQLTPEGERLGTPWPKRSSVFVILLPRSEGLRLRTEQSDRRNTRIKESCKCLPLEDEGRKGN